VNLVEPHRAAVDAGECVLVPVAVVLVQADTDGVGGDVQRVHNSGAGSLKVAVALGTLDGNAGAVAADQVAGVPEGVAI
jgi:hypothetical protein